MKSNNAFSDAKSIASYVLSVKPMDNLKLQKILFYIQAVSLVKYNKKAYSETIEAWDYGPVIPDIYYLYRHNGVDTIKADKASKKGISIELTEAIDLVLGYYGEKTGIELIHETHSEAPWLNAYKSGYNVEIMPADIKKYYKKIFSFS